MATGNNKNQPPSVKMAVIARQKRRTHDQETIKLQE